jgi:hypothetical protein
LNDTTMTERQKIYFELFDAGDIVRLEPIELLEYDSELDWDKNWIKTKVTVKGGKFSGQYSGEFMTIDFEKFKHELSRLYENLKGTANFNDLEGYLELKINGDGIGHFEVNVKACDKPGVNASELTFTMGFDQTELKELIKQLDNITKQFPIIGNC